MQDVEDVGEQRGVRCLMPWQGLEQLPGACHHERQDQPVWLRQGQRPFGGLVRRALVTELPVGEPGQQLGASVGTALLSTIFATAVTSYITAHLAAARIIGRQALTGLALAHGYDTVFWWTALRGRDVLDRLPL